MADVIMPKMGDAMTEGKVLTWRKKVGDAVSKGEPVAEIETDKINVDIEAEETGTLVEIVVDAGQSAPVGAKIAAIGPPGAKPEAAKPAAAPAKPAAPAAAPAPSAPARATPGGPPAVAPTTDGRIKASPLAKRMAEERGLDLSRVRGTGPEGRITKEDVEAALASRPAAAATAPTAAGAPAVEFTEQAPTRMRGTIARRMVESKQQVPHFYITAEVMMDEALRARQQLNASLGEDRRVTVNDFVIRATALALRKFPNLNAAYVNGTIRHFTRVNIAIAIALPEGLLAPVLRDCDQKSIPQIGAEAEALAERARGAHLRPQDYEGGTFTVSNLGMFDFVESFIAIINPPHAGILAVGAAQPRAVVRNGQTAVASVMKVTISADHRVTDGAEAAQFLGEVKRLLENPFLLLLQVS
ncbi:MAG TPA: dihydrolipoamide acetyltransferase family protein [bacterium]|jgi:pyruvate dehydrogenase E2 component (dihydrolipoamide acetyltransferase)|nr:dihydrolipoamide acetyltransferase family protein [bacterium]